MKKRFFDNTKYRYADGTFLENGTYTQHTSTRFKNYCEGMRRFPERFIPHLYDNIYGCCGCSACEAICPQQAISMEEDEAGFLYPVVDLLKCIRCFQCERVCDFKKSGDL